MVTYFIAVLTVSFYMDAYFIAVTVLFYMNTYFIAGSHHQN
jgi:hypothetical protein